ncbi:MAG TPA: sulfatase-like hydrolase/transferase [Lacunisphaera sp.]|jgi:arylsulfatase A-like enzyme|nr:sulfatase-like hydrolase/transferase [Lacunisphaera sp.]
MPRPNILWILTTQWRAMATGYAGDPNARTPWLDGLASEAVDYTQAVTPHPLGPQARAALLTGRLCPENGVNDYWDPLPIYVREAEGPRGDGHRPPLQAEKGDGHGLPQQLGRTVAHALHDRGYVTGFFGKWHLAERDRLAPFVGEEHARTIVPPERRGGFDLWEGFESGFLLNDPWLHGTRLPAPRQFKGYQADVLGQRAAAWCREETSRELTDGPPWFCLVSLEAPHPPYHAPAAHVAERKPAAIKLRANIPLGSPAEKIAREELAGYYAHIEATDRAIGSLLSEIDLADTIVVFTSVHGDMHGAHGLFRKAWPHEESVRVPMLVRFPGGKSQNAKGQTPNKDPSPVSLVDLPHMAVAWAEGREWHCRRDSAAISMPTVASIPLQCDRAWRGFRSPRHKLVLNADGSPWLFFDLANDPLEMKNLVEDPARRPEIEELKALL